MTPLELGLIISLITILVLALGVPVAFGLTFISLIFIFIFEGVFGLRFVGELFFSGLDDFTLISIPMFIAMGAAVASSPAGADLYGSFERLFRKVPGGLAISNIGACSIFSALSGSSPATCAAIGKMGIPEMQKRGYPDSLATGAIAAGGTLGILIPPSVTMIVYGIATGTSIGRLFLAGIGPGILITLMFCIWAVIYTKLYGQNISAPPPKLSLSEFFVILPRVLPFILLIILILYVLYGGIATPSEAAGVGAVICFLLIATVYKIWQPKRLWEILRDCTKESVMIMMIIAAAALFSYMLSALFVTQSMAEYIADLDMNRWILLLIVNIFLLVAGFFLPPVAVIVMTAPVLIPIITSAGFDPYWFAVILTINMEIGLITPPVGLNLYVINGIAPNVKLNEILRGALPFAIIMVLAIIIISIFPEIATWIPDQFG